MKKFNLLSNLPATVTRRKKRIGRGLGSGRGAKSGRGTTRHQKARESIPLHFEGGQARMIKRFPLLRGKGRNKSKNFDPFTLTLDKLNVFHDNEEVTTESIIEKKIVKAKDLKIRGFKILAGGSLTKKLIVKVPISKTAKKQVAAAGGRVVA